MQEFKLDLPNGITISSVLSETEVSVLSDVNKRDMKNGYVWYSFPSTEVKGKKISFELCFFEGVIQSINIAMLNSELYGGGWNDFSETKEKKRAKDTEKWLSSIGYKIGKYSWGEVWAGYDSKGGSGCGVVRYAL